MSKFIWKPDVIDFGYEAGNERVIKFIHEATSIDIISTPSWMSDATVSFDTYSGDSPAKGTITASVRLDQTRVQEQGFITVMADTESYLIPVVFNYDSEHVPILEVVDNLMISAGDEGYISERDRNKAILAAKRWIQDNAGIAGTNVRFSEISVVNNTVPLPGDFVDLRGVYVVTSDGYLCRLYQSDNINIGQEVLQDEDAFVLLDDFGYAISGFGLTPRVDNEAPYTYYGIDVGTLSQLGGQVVYQIKAGTVSGNGLYRYDRHNRVIIIDGVNIQTVVVEYVSDPLLRHKLKMDMGEIRIHKRYQEALEAYLYYKLIEINRLVPIYEKQRALQAYKLAMKRASVKAIDYNALRQVLKGI